MKLKQIRDGFVIYRNQLEAIAELPSLADVKTIVRALIAYGMDGEDVKVPQQLAFGWRQMKGQLDIQFRERENLSAIRAEAAAKRWNDAKMQKHARSCKRMQDHASDAEEKRSELKYTPPDGGVLTARTARTPAPAGEYPATVEEVIAISQEPGCAAPMTPEQADAYFCTRLAGDWVDASGRRIRPAMIPFDIKKWVLADKRRNRGSSPRRRDDDIPVRQLTEEEARYGCE